MILEQETFEKYGYKPLELKKYSNKLIIIKCDYCNQTKERKLSDLTDARRIIKKDSCADKQCKILKKREGAKIKFHDSHPKIGNRFGYWEVISEVKQNKTPARNGGWYYYITCKCKCGTIRDLQLRNLMQKKKGSLSCGYYKIEEIKKRQTKHNKCHTKIHRIWTSMKQRCYNQNDKAYKWYGKKI